MVDKKSQKVICTSFSNGKMHDFKLFKESNVVVQDKVIVIIDPGYQSSQKIHSNTFLSKKKRENKPLTKEDKKNNPAITIAKSF